MSHKRVEKRTLDRIESEIAQANASIARIRTFGGYGKESKEAVVGFLRDVVEACGQTRDEWLRRLGMGTISPDAQHAITWAAAQQDAYKNILTLLEDPDKAVARYKEELVLLGSEKDAYKRYEPGE